MNSCYGNTLLDAVTLSYQAGDSLIIHNPVFFLSEPLDIWVHKKHKHESRGQLLETSLQFIDVTHTFLHMKCNYFHTGSSQLNINRIEGFQAKTATWYKIKLFLSRPQFERGGKLSENQSLLSKWPCLTTSETEHVWFCSHNIFFIATLEVA